MPLERASHDGTETPTMIHRPGATGNSAGGSPNPLGWTDVATYAISAALLAGVTISTGSVQDGAVAVTTLAAAVRAVRGRQGPGLTP